MVGIGNMEKMQKYKDILELGGITFMDVTGGKKNAADGKIIVEMLVWAFKHEVHHAPGSILLIACDSDYFAVLDKLRKRGFNMLVAHHKDLNKKLSQPANSDWLWLWKELSKEDISEELIQKLRRHTKAQTSRQLLK